MLLYLNAESITMLNETIMHTQKNIQGKGHVASEYIICE